jgi:hypothetical protein
MSGVVMVLVAGPLSGLAGSLLILKVTAVICAIGAGIAWRSDRAGKVFYALDGDTLLLRRNGDEERIPVYELRDASLVDRMAARDLIRGRMKQAQEAGRGKEELRRMQQHCLRYCTVDIGMNSLTFGLGRQLIDQRPDAKHDLVLIRSVDGSLRVLSPMYNQDLVESLNRAIHSDLMDRVRNRA